MASLPCMLTSPSTHTAWSVCTTEFHTTEFQLWKPDVHLADGLEGDAVRSRELQQAGMSEVMIAREPDSHWDPPFSWVRVWLAR